MRRRLEEEPRAATRDGEANRPLAEHLGGNDVAAFPEKGRQVAAIIKPATFFGIQGLRPDDAVPSEY